MSMDLHSAIAGVGCAVITLIVGWVARELWPGV